MERVKEISFHSLTNVVKIVLKRCPRTEMAVKELLQNGHNNNLHPCPVCGSIEQCTRGLQSYYGMSPVQVDLFRNLIMALTLEATGGGSDGSMDQGEEDVQNNTCSECLDKFDMLESLGNEISLLENKVEEILSQLRKTIKDRRAGISLLNSTVPNAVTTTTKSGSSTHLLSATINDMEEEDGFEASTQEIKPEAEYTDDLEEDLDLKPVILQDFQNELQDLLKELPNDDAITSDDPLLGGGVGSIPPDLCPINKPEEEGDHTSGVRSRRCKIRATQVIADILRNDDDDDDDKSDEYSPINESETDSDNPNELDELDILKEHKHKQPGIPSDPSVRSQKEDDKHTCSVCGKQVVHLRDHMTRHRQDRKRFSCEVCYKRFYSKKSLLYHRERVHLQNVHYKCEKCGKGFYTVREHKRHLNMRIPCTEVLRKRKFICPLCNAGFSLKDNLRRHTITVHRKGKTVKCLHSTCRFKFFTKEDCQRHLELCHPLPPSQTDGPTCTIWNEKFSNVQDQIAHTCRFCFKSFPNKDDLEEHKAIHKGDKPYDCTKCGYEFCRLDALKVHLKVTNCNPDKEQMAKARERRRKYTRELLARKRAAHL